MGSRRGSRFGGEEEEDRSSDVDEWAGFKRKVSVHNMLNNTMLHLISSTLQAYEYSDGTSIHGIKYIGERERPGWER